MPTFTQDLDIWTLILHASFVVKVVMAVLVAVSFMSWMFIFQKWFVLRRAVSQTLRFERGLDPGSNGTRCSRSRTEIEVSNFGAKT